MPLTSVPSPRPTALPRTPPPTVAAALLSGSPPQTALSLQVWVPLAPWRCCVSGPSFPGAPVIP
eukprot:6189049-Pleurochrysis_carterae.AAC.2